VAAHFEITLRVTEGLSAIRKYFIGVNGSNQLLHFLVSYQRGMFEFKMIDFSSKGCDFLLWTSNPKGI